MTTRDDAGAARGLSIAAEEHGRRKFIYASGAAWGAFLLCVLLYVWVVSAGSWTRWPSYSDYYHRLGDAFRHGQCSLLETPASELLSLADPYDPRANEPYRLHDASLYNGRYYLYWGPLPGVIAAAAQSIFRVSAVRDEVLVFTFSVLSLAAATALLVRIWKRHFAALPVWSLALGVLALGVSNPMPSNLARASVYEAAITAANASLMGGMACVLTAVDRRGPPALKLIFTGGALLACAVGSRVSTLLPVAAIVAFVIWRSHLLRASESTSRDRRVWYSTALVAPIACVTAGLALYNFRRFGSITEFGVRFQLSEFNSPLEYRRLTSVAYVAPNLWSYLFRTPEMSTVFPFVTPRSGLDVGAFPSLIRTPTFYGLGEATTGMLWAAPFALLGLAGPMFLNSRSRRNIPEAQVTSSLPRWVWPMLLTAAAVAAVPALLVSLPTTRYLTDWTPLLLLASVTVFWKGMRELQGRWRTWAWTGLCVVAAGVTVIVGPLLAITGASGHFAQHNPRLLKEIVEATYLGDTPAIARIGSPAGLDPIVGGDGFWLGQGGTTLDVMCNTTGWYRLSLVALPGPCLEGRSAARLAFAANFEQPLARSGDVLGIAELPRREDGAPFTANVRLREGLNRLYLFTPDLPVIPVQRNSSGDPGCRKMIGIRELNLAPASAPR